ncbi:MAG: hypothetical protein LBS53_10395, partial [Synergistaceae bacterium]|nr:hypothetical protein [Synergistaceae bacterium]
MNTAIRLLKKREALLSLFIAAAVVAISCFSDNFLTYDNIANILKSFTVTGIFSIGVLLVIISGGMDVSFTAIAQVAQYIVVYVLLNYISGNIWLAFALAVVVGIAMGLFNGFLIYHYKMPAIIITIATQSLFYGLMYVITRGKLLYEVPPYFWSLADAKIFTIINSNGTPSGLSVVTVLWFALAL